MPVTSQDPKKSMQKPKSILVIGSGPIVIGQACEFDYSGSQALRTLKEEGIRVVLINSNPATIMTDPGMADAVYIEPLTAEFAERIIAKEKPEALLPTLGGQTALNLAVELATLGILERHGVKLIGASFESIRKAEDRELFKQTMVSLGIDVPLSKQVSNVEEGYEALKAIGLPIILRPSFTLGGEGGGIANTEEEFFKILERGLFLSPTNSVLLEESLLGWKEYELEVVRDRKDNVIIVCSIENVDPMGIHTGDSITVAPAQTLTDRQYQYLRDLSKKIIRAIGVESGGCNIQFAVDPKTGRTTVIEMNPRVSRSSALASKATGFPIAKVATRLALGYCLNEILNDITGTTPASFEPTIDYVVTKIPRFDFHKFTASPQYLGTQMKSVGESMAIGRTFKESFLKALSGMENGHTSLLARKELLEGLSSEDLQSELQKPLWTRIYVIAQALRKNLSVQTIHELTGFDPWFLNQFKTIVQMETELSAAPISENWKNLTHENWITIKSLGFPDETLATLWKTTPLEILKTRIKLDVRPRFDQVDTCAGEFEAKTPYLYSTYCIQEKVQNTAPRKKNVVVILGSGTNRIGQGIEFDYTCVHAALAAKGLGYESVMINYNPETVSTDYDISSRLYFEPLTLERVYAVLEHEGLENIRGVIVQFGGQTPLKLCHDLEALGVPILGTPVKSIDIAEDRALFEELLNGVSLKGLKQAPSVTASDREEALRLSEKIGFPMMVRPSYVLGGRGMRIVFTRETLEKYIGEALEVSEKKPVLLDRYLAGATEVDVDALSDGKDVIIAGVLEHIEEAGIHSGDSACSLPAFTLSKSITDRLRQYTRELAKALNVVGLMNIQFAVLENDIFVLEVNPRASRTVPFIAKACGIPLPKIATRLMLGESLKDLLKENGRTILQDFDQDLEKNRTPYFVKMPVFPFHKFPGVDVILGPEMKSTGESMGQAETFGAAYAKALLGAGTTIPTHGRALLSVADEDKTSAILEIARTLHLMGFRMECTVGTYDYLAANGIPCEKVQKVGEQANAKVDNCVARIKQNHYSFVINTTVGEKSILDSYAIRRTALEKRIPYCTLVSAARAFVRAIASLKEEQLPLSPPLSSHWK